MRDTIVEFNDVSFIYPGEEDKSAEALDNINVSIRHGEFVAVIGRNGSGKSTFARHINALFKPSRGDVIVDGMNTKDDQMLWAIRQTAGMVFQNPDNQLIATIVEEDVAFGPENLGVPHDEIVRRVHDALELVDMAEYAHFAPHMLSGGQKQRVAIAGIIAMHPKCIVLDEPTAMLDPTGRQEVMATIKHLNEDEGITVILITHFMEEAVQADRILVMDYGHIIMDDVPKKIFTRINDIKQAGLDIPAMTELAINLRDHGLNIPPDILTVEEMAEALCLL
ncbi:energy-coupling factor transporter ATPase [Mahella australiensis]|uniref:ABC transporter ATP-binding protein n=1 Tax=Mahella australiensis (strain DSM 15567 / CIP 107919 / 50-1 BON) TaxID=697281 RepID=F4A2V4_MAHA5|nr:energy-coupling factor transporter ATPase [Mahella australiensis]AEE97297.1 ABC transporter related protein [Mahella australiensis 50-1 BON]